MDNLSYYQFNFHCHCYSTYFVTNGSIYLNFNRANIINHITRTLQVPWNYHFILRSHQTINLITNLTFTVTVIQPLVSQMDLYIFTSTDQIELSILQQSSKSHGTIISSPGPLGLFILTTILHLLSLLFNFNCHKWIYMFSLQKTK